ncbi:unnamed protein product [Schistosoma curassoni]|uniref:PNP_UDP_1 domain-containing protein n=1 Tax=Schistosoma curassoni TaxID=6186 RepID=A0A183KVJ8_9TREM|nr:unnamed protein product [Schistosoma curassoni]
MFAHKITSASSNAGCISHRDHSCIITKFYDNTRNRELTFYGSGPGSLKGVLHMPMADPFCEETRQVLIKAAKNLSLTIRDKTCSSDTIINHPCVHTEGSVITINGPRFSTRCESLLFQKWGFDLINMTLVPEVSLAREAGLSYASIAIVTDFDCWKADEEHVRKLIFTGYFCILFYRYIHKDVQ